MFRQAKAGQILLSLMQQKTDWTIRTRTIMLMLKHYEQAGKRHHSQQRNA